MLKYPSPCRASFVKHSLQKLKRIGDKSASLSNSSSSLNTSCLPSIQSHFNPLIHVKFANQFLSPQSILLIFRIFINLVQFILSNAFCQSMKQIHSSSSISKFRSAIILIIPIASLVTFPLLNPNWSSPSKTSISLSKLLCYYLCCMWNKADCAMVAAFCSLCLLL